MPSSAFVSQPGAEQLRHTFRKSCLGEIVGICGRRNVRKSYVKYPAANVSVTQFEQDFGNRDITKQFQI
jgi:hypothetical protein